MQKATISKNFNYFLSNKIYSVPAVVVPARVISSRVAPAFIHLSYCSRAVVNFQPHEIMILFHILSQLKIL